jgi:hypothetical protein
MLTRISAAIWCTLSLIAPSVLSQVPAAPASTPSIAAPTVSKPSWRELSAQQQESLKPLASTWDQLGEMRKRKWLSIAQTYPQLAAPEQEKLHVRMEQWAALKPNEREQARLNFAETKKIPPAERAAIWETYQALSDEEKKELAGKARKKPAGAAVAVKPVAPEKLAAVPVTRLTPEPIRERQAAMLAIDRNTLLPVAQKRDVKTPELKSPASVPK